MDSSEFNELISACQELADSYPEGIVFIGGIAVYLHCRNHTDTAAYAEFTHDGDFYISLSDMGDLRDVEELRSNRKLNKHQLRKRGFDFDVYTEYQSALIVPYDQVLAYAVNYDALKISCVEHLVALKLEAYLDRRTSARGEKDSKDLIRLMMVAESGEREFNPEICLPYLRDDHLKLLEEIKKGPDFLSLTKGNAKSAKEIRTRFEKFVVKIISSQ